MMVFICNGCGRTFNNPTDAYTHEIDYHNQSFSYALVNTDDLETRRIK